MATLLHTLVLLIAINLSYTNAFSPPPSYSITQRGTSSSLNSSPPSSKSREQELARLAQRLDVSPTKLRELLFNQRRKLKDDNHPNARRIDWLLNDADSNTKSVVKAKKTAKKQSTPNKNSDVAKRQSTKKSKQSTTSERKVVDKQNHASTLLSDVQFAKRTDLHPATKRALTETLGLTTMTDIQAKTYPVALSGKDVLGRARTGTGKTISFLLPSIERLLRMSEYDESNQVGIVVISPTRELASQIGDEAEKLLSFHKGMSTQVVFGGTKTARDISRLNKRLPTILVATPGRYKDLLQTATVRGKKFSNIMKQTPIIVGDETDQLLDLGFRREIQQILNYMGSNRKRQTLLFSATVPPALKEIMRQTMKDNYVEVDCIKDDGNDNSNTASGETHAHIEQSHATISSMSQYVPSIIRVVKEAAKDDGGGNKVVVFFPTARMVSFFADLFNEVVGLPVLELHSKKSQGYRNRVSGQFREAESGILFTSDVSARGVDYPGVSHVVQFGMPSSREQYVHRLGRTGRGTATSGKGWLVLGPFESLFLEELTKIPIPKNTKLIDLLNKTTLDETDDIMQSLLERVQNGDQVLNKSGEGAYQAFLGYYLGQMKRMRMKRKERLVEIAADFSASMGFRNTPKLGQNMVKKMGLLGVDGIAVSKTTGGKANSNMSPKKDGRTRPKKKVGRRK